MPDEIDKKVKTARMNRLLSVQTEISHRINDKYLGKTERVLVDAAEERDGKTVYTARNSANKLVHFTGGEAKIGEFVNVKIIRTGAFDLFAEI